MKHLILIAALLMAALAGCGSFDKRGDSGSSGQQFAFQNSRIKEIDTPSASAETWSWQVDITNQADVPRECTVEVDFLDIDGFLVIADTKSLVVDADSTITTRGQIVILTPSNIVSAEFGVSCETVE